MVLEYWYTEIFQRAMHVFLSEYNLGLMISLLQYSFLILVLFCFSVYYKPNLWFLLLFQSNVKTEGSPVWWHRWHGILLFREFGPSALSPVFKRALEGVGELSSACTVTGTCLQSICCKENAHGRGLKTLQCSQTPLVYPKSMFERLVVHPYGR